MRKTVLTAVVFLGAASAAQAQQMKASNAATAGIEGLYSMAKGYVLKAAEMVPQEKYSFQPTRDVRSFGAILGHIADASRVVCPAAKGTQVEYEPKFEKLTSKPEIIARLKDTFAACDAVFGGTPDSALGNPASVFGMDMTVSGVLSMQTAHVWEHYGNLVTYLRMMGMVPPSSQGQ